MNNNNHNPLKEKARTKAREILSHSNTFQRLNKNEQYALYKSTVEEEYQKLAKKNPKIAQGMSSDIDPASNLIDRDRHKLDVDTLNKGLDAGVDFIKNVNFPEFVKDLLKGVFDASLEVTREQMEDYQQLLKESTKSVESFASQISKADSLAFLADKKNDEFDFSFSDSEQDEDGNPTPILMDKEGNPVDTEDTKIAALIKDSKREMAEERRTLLREMILMGVTRLVIEKGKVKAKVNFDIKSRSKTVNKDRALTKGRSTKKGYGASWGWGGVNVNRERSSQISISSADSTSTQDASVRAQLMGEVEINFKSDYFKLDNFAEMYAKDKPAETENKA